MLQMPLACIRVGTPESGKAAWFLVEYVEGVNYTSFAHFSEALFGVCVQDCIEAAQDVGVEIFQVGAQHRVT